MKLGRMTKTMAEDVNVKRRARGLLPRAVGVTNFSSFLLWFSPLYLNLSFY